MNAVPATSSVQRPNAFLPILVGGFAAGVLDLTAAFIIYGPGVPRVIAGGILGLKALQGGGPRSTLLALHYSFSSRPPPPPYITQQAVSSSS